MFKLVRKWRRNRLRKQPFPPVWLSILEKKIPFFRKLPQDLRSRFLDLVKVFVHEKKFTPGGGMEITDEVRVVISAVACRLILHLDLDYYDRLSEIVVYPYHLKEPGNPDDPGAYGVASAWGTVALSWPAVISGIQNPTDGHHTALHEFAHILDQADGNFDGAPELHAAEDYRPWAKILGYHFERLGANRRKELRALRPYGATDPAEFFAVASESFFEKPVQMKKHLPDLYAQLHRFYGFDPASDGVDHVPTGKKIGRNNPCPCGSGRKYKRCCGRPW